MNCWPVYSLVDVTDLITCGVAKRPNYVDFGIPFLSAKNVKSGEIIWNDFRYINEEDHRELTKNNKPIRGDILYTRVGSYGEAAIVDSDDEFSVFVSLTIIKPKHNLLYNKYLKYYLNSSYVKTLAKASISGSGVGNLNVGTVRKFPIPLPSMPEQKSIATLLDTVFADLEQARAKTEQNLKNARELFDSYLQQVFSQKGDGWESIPLGEVADLVDSLHTTPKYIDEGGFPMVRVTEIKKSGLSLKKAKRVDQETYEKFSKRHKSCVGDIILSRVGASYGIPVIVETNEIFCLGQNTVFILPKINAYWLYYFLLSPAAKEQIDGFVAGSAQPTVSMKSIRQLIVPIPSKLERDRIEPEIKKVLSESNKLIEIYQKKLNSIAELKKSILQKAFSGELTTTAK